MCIEGGRGQRGAKLGLDQVRPRRMTFVKEIVLRGIGPRL